METAGYNDPHNPVITAGFAINRQWQVQAMGEEMAVVQLEAVSQLSGTKQKKGPQAINRSEPFRLNLSIVATVEE